MNKIKFYCVTNKPINFIKKEEYNFGWVGKEIPEENYITCDYSDKIFYKEKYYSELTFHYWFWKNMLDVYDNNKWIGFCQKRRFWIKSETEKIDNIQNLKDSLLNEVPKKWENYDAFLCESISVSPAKKMKLIKRGWRNIIKNPSILIDEKKHNIKLQFDMFHGHGILDKAIELLPSDQKYDFQNYVNNEIKFHPNIMMISKKKILKKWFENLFKWLFRCEKIFGFDELLGYDKGRLYAYLSERYLSFWFSSYYKTKEISWKFFDTVKNT